MSKLCLKNREKQLTYFTLYEQKDLLMIDQTIQETKLLARQLEKKILNSNLHRRSPYFKNVLPCSKDVVTNKHSKLDRLLYEIMKMK